MHVFYAYIEQKNAGCDYSIACGKILWKLEAQTAGEAIDELRLKIIGRWLQEYCEYEGGMWDEYEVSGITLLEVKNEVEICPEQWYLLARQEVAAAKQRASNDAERRLYDKLKIKFEGA